jgi:flagellar motility protein MotE (MotC chaperone)
VPSALVTALLLAAAPTAPVAPAAPTVILPAPPLGTGPAPEGIPSGRAPARAVNPAPSPSPSAVANPHPRRTPAVKTAPRERPTRHRSRPELQLPGLGVTSTPPPPPRAAPSASREPARPSASREPARPKEDEASPVPPALTAAALRDEILATAHHRTEELRSLASERARLEKLAADIAAARTALLGETALLERKLKEGPPAEKPAAAAPPAARRAGPEPKPRGEILAKTLKGMKPSQAASLLARLERPLAVEILRRMRPADAGTVLEKMKAETAADLLTAMAADPADGAHP